MVGQCQLFKLNRVICQCKSVPVYVVGQCQSLRLDSASCSGRSMQAIEVGQYQCSVGGVVE